MTLPPTHCAPPLPAVVVLLATPLALACGPGEPAQSSALASTDRAGVESFGPTNLVRMDGQFDDWLGQPVVLSDPMDAPDSPVDLGRVQAASDGRYLYLSLETGREVNAQAMEGGISVLVDADADPGTGEALFDLAGVDLVLELSRGDVPRPGGRGTGIGVRTRGPDGRLQPTVHASNLDVLVTPTYASHRFELRIARGHEAPAGLPLLAGHRVRIALAYANGGRVLDRTDTATIELAPLDPDAGMARWSEPLDPGNGVTRVLVWNVSHTIFRDHPERFAPVIAALEPDVVLLDEVHRAVGEADLRDFFSREPLGNRGPWDVVAGASGGTQMTVVASRIALRPEARMAGVRHEDDSLATLAVHFRDGRAQREFALERERGIPTVGAWVDLDGLPVLFVPVDLKSAGYDGSWEDRLREVQAARVRERVAEVLGRAGGSASAVIAGDLNLVGSRRPLDIIGRGLDDGADLAPADAYRLTDGSLATWRDGRQPFTPGRLDFVLVPTGKLDVQRSFTFDASELAPDLLSRLGVRAESTMIASDHLPIVVDLVRRSSES